MIRNYSIIELKSKCPKHLKKLKNKRGNPITQINFELHNLTPPSYSKYNYVFSDYFKIRPFKIQYNCQRQEN